MKAIDKTPFWVTLAYANVHTRKMALILVFSCVVFALYCVPWVQFSKNAMVAKLFLIDEYKIGWIVL